MGGIKHIFRGICAVFTERKQKTLLETIEPESISAKPHTIACALKAQIPKSSVTQKKYLKRYLACFSEETKTKMSVQF